MAQKPKQMSQNSQTTIHTLHLSKFPQSIVIRCVISHQMQQQRQKRTDWFIPAILFRKELVIQLPGKYSRLCNSWSQQPILPTRTDFLLRMYRYSASLLQQSKWKNTAQDPQCDPGSSQRRQTRMDRRLTKQQLLQPTFSHQKTEMLH